MTALITGHLFQTGMHNTAKATVFYYSRGMLAINLKQIPYQNIFVPRSCRRSGLATQNLFTLDIHRRIFMRVKSKMADYLT